MNCNEYYDPQTPESLIELNEPTHWNANSDVWAGGKALSYSMVIFLYITFILQPSKEI